MRMLNSLNTRFYRWMLCLFMAAFFADSANLPDIFAGQTVIVDHDDEDAAIAPRCAHFQSPSSLASQTHLFNDASALKKAPRVLYDVDSVSLQAEATAPFVSIQALFDERTAQVSSPFYVENLYLRNSSLLI
jgi:hypothetical protein